ncbi:hypothetical protein OSTOST_24713 [Ostertagia ostertagi]
MPIAKSVVRRCMDRVFEVADDNEDIDVSGSFSQPLKSTPGSAVRSSPATLRQNKWTPPDSLTWRFAMSFANASVDYDFGPHGFAQVWLEFVKRLRTYYDSTKDLPGLGNVTQPNLSHCLLHQKIQMLQCCISAKRRRHELYDNTKDFGGDEFFDAQSDQSDADSSSTGVQKSGAANNCVKASKPSSIQEPSGRLHPFGEMRLLKHKDTPLYDRSPMTEDMVDEYANYLSSLDDGEARVRAQLDVLCSDMQAFKVLCWLSHSDVAASFFVNCRVPVNPKCCLRRFFIRWHSPKDWIEEEECLSERMQLPDNTWVKCWNEAMPIPVINQARLFNESKIAEEILSLLENATVQQMVDFIRPVLFVAAVVQVVQRGKCVRNLLNKEVLADSVYRANRKTILWKLLKHLKAAELFLSQYSSLHSKLRVFEHIGNLIEPPTEDDLFSFITSLIEDASAKRESIERNVISRGVPIFGASDGPLGNAVRIMMERDDVTGGKLPAPSRRQYIIRWTVPRPSACSRLVPQRLFASIEQDEFRLCGAFAEDSVIRRQRDKSEFVRGSLGTRPMEMDSPCFTSTGGICVVTFLVKALSWGFVEFLRKCCWWRPNDGFIKIFVCLSWKSLVVCS